MARPIDLCALLSVLAAAGLSGCLAPPVEPTESSTTTTHRPTTTPSTPTSGLWNIDFRPGLDLSVCHGAPLTWTGLDVTVEQDGTFGGSWSVQYPGTLSMTGHTDGHVFVATLACGSGMASGSVHATRAGSSFAGVFRFDGAQGTVSIARPSMETPQPTWTSTSTSHPPTTTPSSSAAPTTSAAPPEPTGIKVGSNANHVAVTPDGRMALVTFNTSPGAVRIVSLAQGQVLSTIATDPYPGSVVITPDGTTAVVAHAHSLSIIDLATATVTASVATPCIADSLYGLAMSPDGKSVATTVLSSGCTRTLLGILDIQGKTIATGQDLNLGQATQGVAYAPDGASVIVALGATGTKVLRVPVGSGPMVAIPDTSSTFSLVLIPGTTDLLASSGEGETVKRISLASNAVTSTIDCGSNQATRNVAVTPDGAHAIVVAPFDTCIVALATGTVETTYDVGGNNVAVTPDGRLAVVTLGDSLQVYEI